MVEESAWAVACLSLVEAGIEVEAAVEVSAAGTEAEVSAGTAVEVLSVGPAVEVFAVGTAVEVEVPAVGTAAVEIAAEVLTAGIVAGAGIEV